jgi:predicted benzoate:H+ symporter BenE
MLTLFAIAVEHSSDHGDKTPFYVAAGVFAAWAVLVGVIGVTRETFPSSGSARVVMLISGVLMLATLATAVITAS